MGIRSITTLLLSSLLVATLLLALPATSAAQIAISVSFGPPPLPVYMQPLCPGAGYLWTPGYWAYSYDYDDYYWVPGTWVLAPQPGLFWTPGYWAWTGNGFVFHDGYWAPQVGFYGGINYGYGYFGQGYQGGRWDRGRFYYNRAVNNVNVTNVRYVYYNTTVINNRTVNRISYNGGNGGINARPQPQEQAVARERHIPPVPAQTQHVREAKQDPQLRASANQGKPPVAATPKPGAFRDREVVSAKEAGGPYKPPANRAANRPESPRRENARPENRNNRQPDNARPDNPRPDNRPENKRPGPPPDANPRAERDVPNTPAPANERRQPPPNASKAHQQGQRQLEQKEKPQKEKQQKQQERRQEDQHPPPPEQ